MKSEAHILIVDDDEAIRDLLHEFLPAFAVSLPR
jgi:two-component system OmpR family response regulator